ncbi:hypothetical protein [Lewinella sp. W8]|uniref:gliding motility lipoprotein GldD n=1 Tax=Lewinella sp. W8 TaxID=2528208 RepID=UPI001067AF7D|nr:hypothetical protein [Lewinella sp. W8]MTB53389.1 hypothetical protein [Lewinella sp. W8]
MRFSLPTIFLLVCLALCGTGCDGDVPPVPKPRSYPRIMYPDRDYRPVSSEYCDFTFNAPVSAQMVREELFFDEAPPDSCWFDLKLDPALNGKIHFSYYPVTSYAQWEELRDQAFELVGVHNSRASDIEEIVIHREENDVHGIAFDIAGPAASPFQFFLTDSTNHFLRGALYFDTTIQPDSLAPVIDYVKEDIFTIMESFRWEAR